MPPERLLHIAMLCEQYQCIRIVAPWASSATWFKIHLEPARFPRTSALTLTWTFGNKAEFSCISKRLVKEVYLDVRGNVFTGKGLLVVEPLPPGILGMAYPFLLD